MVVVYLSCAMSAPTYAQFRKNCRRAARLGHRLRHAGFAVINPAENAFHRPDKEMSWGKWLRHDEALIDRVDVVYRLLPDPAGRPSKGAEREVKYAKEHGIPVVFDQKELRAVARGIDQKEQAS